MSKEMYSPSYGCAIFDDKYEDELHTKEVSMDFHDIAVKRMLGNIGNATPIYGCYIKSSDDEDVLDENNIKLELGDFVMKLPGEVHRWYTESTNIYKCDDGYVGITGFDYGHEDSVDPRDCLRYCKCFAEEFEPKQTITYVPIRK